MPRQTGGVKVFDIGARKKLCVKGRGFAAYALKQTKAAAPKYSLYAYNGMSHTMAVISTSSKIVAGEGMYPERAYRMLANRVMDRNMKKGEIDHNLICGTILMQREAAMHSSRFALGITPQNMVFPYLPLARTDFGLMVDAIIKNMRADKCGVKVQYRDGFAYALLLATERSA